MGRELENQVHVVSHDSRVDDPGSVTARDLGKDATQERSRSGMDQGQPA